MFRNSVCEVTRLLQKCTIGLPGSISSTLQNTGRASSVLAVVPARHRWWDSRKPVLRRFGYEDKLEVRGTLPRIPEIKERLPIPPYVPKMPWTEKRALFGQNDYIDILGDGSIHPTQIGTGVPAWLRGFHGNEYQMLLRKRKFFGIGLRKANPEKYNDLEKRIRYLFKVHNWRRRFHFHPEKA